ncbi:MAG: ErmCL family antibiotic resistance leader peptide [Tissierellaceae bacterium]
MGIFSIFVIERFHYKLDRLHLIGQFFSEHDIIIIGGEKNV